jgi:hypothetical protein
MKTLDHLYRFFLRFRYPVSLPEDIAVALGIQFSSFLTFQELVEKLTSPTCCPTKLMKFMSREDAEAAFEGALRKECFQQNSLFSYFFIEGWMEFVLQFDEHARLRRVYIQHKHIPHDRGIELILTADKQDEQSKQKIDLLFSSVFICVHLWLIFFCGFIEALCGLQQK